VKKTGLPAVDACDLRILSLLQEDARTSNAEIGRVLGMVPSAIHHRVGKLRRQGIIDGYEARVDARAVGLGLAAFVFVRVDERAGEHGAATRLIELAEVQELHHVAGEDCYLLKVRVPDAEELGRFLREKLGAMESVRSTRTTVVLETLKETIRLPLGRARERT
jgi:Lrp/AsnC family leucine-responsive transcriptional regulator